MNQIYLQVLNDLKQLQGRNEVSGRLRGFPVIESGSLKTFDKTTANPFKSVEVW